MRQPPAAIFHQASLPKTITFIGFWIGLREKIQEPPRSIGFQYLKTMVNSADVPFNRSTLKPPSCAAAQEQPCAQSEPATFICRVGNAQLRCWGKHQHRDRRISLGTFLRLGFWKLSISNGISRSLFGPSLVYHVILCYYFTLVVLSRRQDEGDKPDKSLPLALDYIFSTLDAGNKH